MENENLTSFAEVKARLDEIVKAVSDDSLPLDDALTLYEEAVSLGLKASDLLESNIAPSEEAAVADSGDEADVASASDDQSQAGSTGGIA